MNIWLVIFKGMLMGVGAAAPIGPVNVEIARRTLRGGFRQGLALGCGAVTIDCIFAVLATLGVAPLVRYRPVYWAMLVCSVGLLGYLGVLSVLAALRSLKSSNDETKSSGQHAHQPAVRGYSTGLLMTGLNPMTWMFWFVALPGVAGQITPEPARDLPWLCVGVFIATLGWVVCFSGALAVLGRFKKRIWMFAADLVGGTMLLGFAAYAFFSGLRQL